MIEEDLRSALTALIDGIKRSDAQRITDSLSALDRILAERRSELDPRLIHFLSRRSYEKALAHLEESGRLAD